MPRTQKIITPKGQRYPGSGSKKGYVRPVSVEARQLVTEMVASPSYQARLRRDFDRRKLHPTIESLVWAYAIGKPKQDIAISGAIDINARLEEDKRVILMLDLPELEALQVKSQALIDEARALVAARTPQDVVVEGETLETGAETLRKSLGSDNDGYGYLPPTSDDIPITPADTQVSTPRDVHGADDGEST